MSGQTTIKMLLIDDKKITTDLDRAGYRKMGVLVKIAGSYDEAVRILKAEPIELMVINMDYKVVDAVNVTRHLKGQDQFKTLPIVMTSVQTAAKVRNNALDAGADLFVEQPLPRQYFIEKLKQLLDQKTRTTERVELDTTVFFTQAGKTGESKIGDLSITGILLSTNVDLPDGTVVEMEFALPENKKPIKVTGDVVRTIAFNNKHPDRQTGVGIRFVDFHGDSQKRLEKYVAASAHDDDRMVYYL